MTSYLSHAIRPGDLRASYLYGLPKSRRSPGLVTSGSRLSWFQQYSIYCRHACIFSLLMLNTKIKTFVSKITTISDQMVVCYF